MMFVRSIVLGLCGAMLAVGCTTTDDVVAIDGGDTGVATEASVTVDTGVTTEAAAPSDSGLVPPVDTGVSTDAATPDAVVTTDGTVSTCNIAVCKACGVSKCSTQYVACATNDAGAPDTGVVAAGNLCDWTIACWVAEVKGGYDACSSAKHWPAGEPDEVSAFTECLLGDGVTPGQCTTECKGCWE